MKQLLRSVGAAAVLACALTMGVRAVELVLPEATAGEPYYYELPAVEGGRSAMASGTLPPGMNVSASEDGAGQMHIVLQGTAAAPGAYAFSVTVNDVEGTELMCFNASLAVLGTAAPVDTPPPETPAPGTPPEETEPPQAGAYTTWIEILTLPVRDSYAVGERIDPTGLTLRLWQSDGSCRDAGEGYTIAPETALAPGAQTVSVTCEGCVAGFVVEVRPQSELTAPTFTRQPEGALLGYGEPCTLYAAATAPAGTLRWQWYRGESEDKSLFVPVGGSPELPLDTHRAGKYYYFARVSCTDGVQSAETDSQVVQVRVMAEKPLIVSQPRELSVPVGTDCELRVEARLTGNGLLSYLWYRSTRPDMNTMTPIDRGRETEATLHIDSSLPGVGYYCVLVSGSENGEITSVYSEIVAVQIRSGEEEAAPTPTAGPAETSTPVAEPPATRPPQPVTPPDDPEPDTALPRLILAGVLGAGVGAGVVLGLRKSRRSRRKDAADR